MKPQRQNQSSVTMMNVFELKTGKTVETKSIDREGKETIIFQDPDYKKLKDKLQIK